MKRLGRGLEGLLSPDCVEKLHFCSRPRKIRAVDGGLEQARGGTCAIRLLPSAATSAAPIGRRTDWAAKTRISADFPSTPISEFFNKIGTKRTNVNFSLGLFLSANDCQNGQYRNNYAACAAFFLFARNFRRISAAGSGRLNK